MRVTIEVVARVDGEDKIAMLVSSFDTADPTLGLQLTAAAARGATDVIAATWREMMRGDRVAHRVQAAYMEEGT